MSFSDIKDLFIVFDTNSIKSMNSKLNEFKFNETYNVFMKFLIGNELDGVKVCIPKIVIEELITQYIEGYHSSKQKIQVALDKLIVEAGRVNWDVNLVKDIDFTQREYIDFIKNAAIEYLKSQKKLIVVDFPSDQKMSKIIKRSIKKRKPFFAGQCQKKKFSDAGFKDVIFLESIIEYSEINKGEYLIVTNDKFLQETEISKEFKCKCEFLDIDTGKLLIEYFEKKYKIKDISKYRQFIKTDYFRNQINEALGVEISEIYKSVKIVETDTYTVIEIKTTILKDKLLKDIIILLSEENELIEIKDVESGEVLYACQI